MITLLRLPDPVGTRIAVLPIRLTVEDRLRANYGRSDRAMQVLVIFVTGH